MEGEQQTPLICQLFRYRLGSQLRGDLIGQAKGHVAAARAAQKIDRRPDARLQADRRAAFQGETNRRDHNRVVMAQGADGRQAQGSGGQPAARLPRRVVVLGQVSESLPGDFTGSCRVIQRLKPFDELSLHSGQAPALIKIAAYAMHCLAGHHTLDHIGSRRCYQASGYIENCHGHLVPHWDRQDPNLLAQRRRLRSGEVHHELQTDHFVVSVGWLCPHDLKHWIDLSRMEDTTGPGHRNSRPRRLRPLDSGVDHLVNDCPDRGIAALPGQVL